MSRVPLPVRDLPYKVNLVCAFEDYHSEVIEEMIFGGKSIDSVDDGVLYLG